MYNQIIFSLLNEKSAQFNTINSVKLNRIACEITLVMFS